MKDVGPQFGKGYTHSLVWKVCPTFQGQTVEMFEALVDAKTSRIHSMRDTVEYFEAKGDVYPFSNDGLGTGGVLQLDWPMPYANVGSEVGLMLLVSVSSLLHDHYNLITSFCRLRILEEILRIRGPSLAI
jgi:hypothetical protein